MLRAAILAGCFLVAADPALAQSKDAFQKIVDAWAAAYNKGDGAAVAALYTDDADVLPDRAEAVHGKAAIAGLVKTLTADPTYANDLTLRVLGVRNLGPNVASQIGSYTITVKKQPQQQEVGKFASVLRKVGGKWLLQTDIWNPNK